MTTSKMERWFNIAFVIIGSVGAAILAALPPTSVAKTTLAIVVILFCLLEVVDDD